MKVGHSIDAFEEFAKTYDVEFHFSTEQEILLEEDRAVVLSSSQLDGIATHISKQSGLGPFLEENARQISPVCMSLYVINKATWDLMQRRAWDKDKMLAMTTMPYCFWDQKEERGSNLKGVNRWELGPTTLAFSDRPPTVTITGNGGDFGGFIRRGMVTSRKFGMPETDDKVVPNYIFQELEITALLDEARIRLHPEPSDELDYDFSESARVFHNHGVHLEIPGEHVNLEVKKRKPARLSGTVHLLIGVPSQPESSMRALLADVWFWLLRRLMEAED